MKYSLFLLPILFFSCSTIPKINKSDVKPITNKISSVYSNRPYLIKTKYGNTKDDSSTTILQLLDTSKNKKVDIDSIQITFNLKGQLQLFYKDTSIFQPIILNGTFSNKGYYEIYFKNEKVEIPPIVHFLFSRHNIKRLRIYETKNNDLIIYEYYFVSGNFLFAGGEGPDERQFFFHRL